MEGSTAYIIIDNKQKSISPMCSEIGCPYIYCVLSVIYILIP